MKKFLLLIYRRTTPSTEPMADVVARYSAWSKKLEAEGRLIDAEGISDQMIVLGPGGSTSDTGVPTIGGYFIFRAGNLDEAIEVSRGCPALEFGGSVELRPVMDY